MSEPSMGYMAIYSIDLSRITSVAAYLRLVNEPLRGVVWDIRARDWVADSTAINTYMFEDRLEERRKIIDRRAAEQIAREQLGVTLPAEDELRDISDAG